MPAVGSRKADGIATETPPLTCCCTVTRIRQHFSLGVPHREHPFAALDVDPRGQERAPLPFPFPPSPLMTPRTALRLRDTPCEIRCKHYFRWKRLAARCRMLLLDDPTKDQWAPRTGHIVSRRDMMHPAPISLTFVDQRHRRRRCELNHVHPVKLASFRHGGLPTHARNLELVPGPRREQIVTWIPCQDQKVLTSESGEREMPGS
jgi:hypothetical protein